MTGEAEVEVAPDQVAPTLGVERLARLLDEATAKNDRAVGRIWRGAYR